MYIFVFILIIILIVIIAIVFLNKSNTSFYKSNDSSDFVILNDFIKDALYDIRYYSSYNFVGSQIDGYEEPLALMTKEAASVLKDVNDELLSMGYCLKIYDAYRPVRAVKHFVTWSKDIKDTSMKKDFYPNIDKSTLIRKGYIAKMSSHSRGSAVDLTLYDIKAKQEVDMGSHFDYFGNLSHFNYKQITKEQHDNRVFLHDIMVKHGFIPLANEWWHFSLEREPYPNTYFDFPIHHNIFIKK